ncbi:hypothetical protein NQ317_017253, partial [Molorchus minor]
GVKKTGTFFKISILRKEVIFCKKIDVFRFERHISTAGRCVAAGHAVGSEAATGAAKPPAGSAQPTPPASQS